jgi:hypothetical protein
VNACDRPGRASTCTPRAALQEGWVISADGLLTARGGSTSHAAVAINGIEGRKYSGVMSAAHLRVHADHHEGSRRRQGS